jgi:hypothetical protein
MTTKDGNKVQAMAYAGLRAYMDRLDEVCGDNWEVHYTPWNDRIICNLTIEGKTRSSTGEMDSQSEKREIGGTVAEAQAFKRACAMFGLGRYLYALPTAWVEYDAQRKALTDNAKRELQARYADWYKRTAGAAPAPQTAPATNGRPMQYVSEETLNRLNTLGADLYQDGWESKRAELAQTVSAGATSDPAQLAETEADMLLSGIEKKLHARNQSAAKPTPVAGK